ncbi:phosphoribosyltransferase [Maribacter polysaccharolyticus]|uniref:phosphoribosyltransferase n=1 Tax=Maribacter polysaccharolyticus TaxID=3020831 RepID=UPI00237F9362|nr:hypothetical protein [Maribacter polysaccharolyticus]MDE3744004.1 hypothetical protein [Maribacter polysaccharolyticus]
MGVTDIQLTPVSFKSSLSGTYNKAIGKQKDELRSLGFPQKKTNNFIRKSLSDKLLDKFKKNTTKETLIVSLPSKKGEKAMNVLPSEYAKILSEKTGLKHVDLNDYMNVRQEQSSRSAYSAQERSTNHFNITFKGNEQRDSLNKILSNKPIILVDDVITTGETLVATATILKMSFPKTEVIGGHALFAVDTRTPTNRDIQRLTEKLEAQMDPSIQRKSIANLVTEALSNFTRKKMMRFELGTKNEIEAKQQFKNLRSDIDKFKTSIRESIDGNLFRYKLDNQEIRKMKESPVEYLSPQLKSRAILQYYPEAKITNTKDGSVHIFSDPSLTKEISDGKGKPMNENSAINSAIEHIKENRLKTSHEQAVSKGNSIGI